MRFMIEVYGQMMEEDPGPALWERYPFEVDGDEVWIPRHKLTIEQRQEMIEAMRKAAADCEKKRRDLIFRPEDQIPAA